MEEKVTKKNEVLGELMEEHVALKKSWGILKKKWVSKEVRDAVVDFVHRCAPIKPINQQQLLNWIGMGASKLYDWEQRYRQRNQHNPSLPRGQWLE